MPKSSKIRSLSHSVLLGIYCQTCATPGYSSRRLSRRQCRVVRTLQVWQNGSPEKSKQWRRNIPSRTWTFSVPWSVWIPTASILYIWFRSREYNWLFWLASFWPGFAVSRFIHLLAAGFEVEASLPPAKAQPADWSVKQFVSFVVLLFLKVNNFQL